MLMFKEKLKKMKIYYVFNFIKKLFLIIICNNLFYSVVILNIFEWGMYNFLVLVL